MTSNYELQSNDALTLLIKEYKIDDWRDLAKFTQALPYGRNANRKDFTLVWTEQKGTCSSKHAFLKHIAYLNRIPNIELILGVYKMNRINTPKIGNVLAENHIEYIPEAHCYLKVNGECFDYTSLNSDFNRVKNDMLLEKEIEPQQVVEFKVDFHKTYIKDWIKNNDIPFSFDKIWELREQCIAKLSS